MEKVFREERLRLRPEAEAGRAEHADRLILSTAFRSSDSAANQPSRADSVERIPSGTVWKNWGKAGEEQDEERRLARKWMGYGLADDASAEFRKGCQS